MTLKGLIGAQVKRGVLITAYIFPSFVQQIPSALAPLFGITKATESYIQAHQQQSQFPGELGQDLPIVLPLTGSGGTAGRSGSLWTGTGLAYHG